MFVPITDIFLRDTTRVTPKKYYGTQIHYSGLDSFAAVPSSYRFLLFFFFILPWQMTVIAGWTTSSAVLFSLIFGLHQIELHPVAAATYSSLSHTLWAMCMSWTVIACATGHGGELCRWWAALCLSATPERLLVHTQWRQDGVFSGDGVMGPLRDRHRLRRVSNRWSQC